MGFRHMRARFKTNTANAKIIHQECIDLPATAEFWTKTGLLERGWTRNLIQLFLGLPDSYGQAFHGHETCYYARARVEAIEAAPAFRTALAAVEARRRAPEPKPVDLLAAIFGVNRSAKRYRNAAQAFYSRQQHGFAGNASRQKSYLYGLKDRGIAEAYRKQRLQCQGLHGGLAIYRGEGYCFHSTLQPKDTESVVLPLEEKHLFVEAKPRGAKEARLCDATATLSALPEGVVDGFTRRDAPRFPSKPTDNRTLVPWRPCYEPDEDFDQDDEDLTTGRY